jgi:hypothetical protein
MKTKKVSLVMVAVFTSVLIASMGFAGPVPGGEGADVNPQVRGGQMPTEEELLQYYSRQEIQRVRDQLFNILNDQMEILNMLGHPVSEAEAVQRRALPDKLRDEDIARWLFVGVDLTLLKQVTSTALEKTASALGNTFNISSPNTTPGFPVASYGSSCSGYSSDSDVVFYYQTALNVAKISWISTSRACEQVAVLFGTGGNTSLACRAVDKALQGAEHILALYTICDGDNQSAKVAANYERLAYINEQIDSDTTAIIQNNNSNTAAIITNDNSNTAAIITNDNSNKTAIINNDDSNTATILEAIDETQELVLRTQIEANLALGVTVALYQLPKSQGGYLETVRDIVTEDIKKLKAAGQRVGNAQHHLDLGNKAYSKGQYKDAYKNYLHAYKAASSPNG